MSKSKSVFRAGLLSVGLLASSMSLQNGVKASVSKTHPKVKYANNQQTFKKSKVSYVDKKVNVSGKYHTSKTAQLTVKASVNPQSQAYGTHNDTYESTTTTNHKVNSANAQNLNETKSTINQNKKVIRKVSPRNTTEVGHRSNVKTSVGTQLRPQRHKVTSKYSSKAKKTLNSVTAKSTTKSTAVTNRTLASTTKASGSMKALIKEGQRYLGASYVYGATGQNNTFDCSGFTKYIYQKFNLQIPRTAQQQYDSLKHIDAKNARVGDLVFFGSDARDVSHVGIYMGHGKMIDAQNQGVITENVNAPWWNLIGYARLG